MDQDPDIDRDDTGGRDTTQSHSQSQSQSHPQSLSLSLSPAHPQSHPQSQQIDHNGSRYRLDHDYHPDVHLSRHQHHDFHAPHDSHDPHNSYDYYDSRNHLDHRDSPDSSPLNLDPSPSSPYKRFPVAANLHAASANAQHAVAATPVVPDDFYKSYRVLSPDDSPNSLPMATSSISRLRSNGDGTTPRHPAVPAGRSQSRSNVGSRSVSSPLDQMPAASASRPSPTSNLSVKDLKKRFDQNGAASSPAPRVPIRSRAATRSKPDSPAANEHQNASTAYANLRSGLQEDSAVKSPNGASPRFQRPKFVAQDQVSSNSQSFASRIGKPRNPANGNSISSKPVTNLAHKSPRPPQPPPSPPPSVPRSHGLLFGEILPEQRDTAAVGHGIAGVRPRRTSESHVQSSGGRPRSFSDVDAEPSSPTSWYRSANTARAESQDTDEPRHNYHSRSQSDAAASLSTPHVVRKSPAKPSPSPASNQPPSTSKLPRAVRKINSPTGSSSPPSTRSNSPTLKRPQSNGRRSRASTAASRARTPTSRAKTPTQPTTGRKPPPPGLVTSHSNTRLQAYAPPQPKLSPPLRSSRPRLPISMAAKPGSRTKESDRSNGKLSAKENESTPRRRKLSIGPIDFEKRREHIRLAYSKSVRENEAVEARQKAAERRRAQMETAAQMKASGESPYLANSASASPTTLDVRRPDHDAVRETHRMLQAKDSNETVTGPAVQTSTDTGSEALNQRLAPSLTISTAMATGLGLIQPAGTKHDSPTLGVPGSFPALSPPADKNDEPQSAISATSATTEFDIEPQTNPPVQALSPADIPITIVKPPSPDTSAHARAEYQYPFHDDPDSPEQDPTSQETVYGSQKTILAPSYRDEPSIPGAFKDDYDEQEDFTSTHYSAYETTVTILPPPQDERSYVEDTREAVPFPRMELYDDSQSESEHVRNNEQRDDDAATDSCTDATDDQDRDDDHYSHFGNQPRSRRASTCASTDAEGPDDSHLAGFRHQATAGTSNGLRAPALTSTNDRLSVLSAWTDFSVDSPNPSDASKSPAMPSGESPSFGHATIFESPAFPRDGEAAFREPHYSNSGVTNEFDRSSGQFSRPQLPEVDTGDGFSIPYLSPGASTSLSYLPSPTHEPPPVPPSVSGSALNSRTSSVYYENSQYGSTLVTSGRGSEDFLSHVETPLSMDDASTADQYFGTQTPADSDAKSLAQDTDGAAAKEYHRLAQRRNVIKELVDTEAVFVRDMNIVEEIYKGTAEACPKLDDQTVKLIFRNSHEIIELHTLFLAQIKEAVASVYVPKGGRSPRSKDASMLSEMSQAGSGDINDANDRETSIGPAFQSNLEKMKLVHEGFLRNSDHAAKKLIQIQQDSTVKVWLNECNEVAKDLTAAWDLDSLLIKPMQRITKYPNLIMTLLQHTPQDHPDREALLSAKDVLETAIIEINKTKKNFELVGQIVGRKRKESDVKAGFARAFGKRVDKLQAPNNRPPEDPTYAKLNEKFGDDYLRLQVVLRDVEFYTRQVSAYVHEFLQYMSSIELVMRLQPGNYPELESKWVQFNISVRDLEKVALEEHLSQVRKQVIEPFELVIKAYGNPSLAMKKRQKRRVDYERSEQQKRGGKSIDPKLKELVEQYEALNDTLKMELPKLSMLTEKVGNICLGNFVNIQANWYAIWKEKMKTLLGDCPDMPDLKEIVSTFHRDHPYAVEQLSSISILDPTYRGRASQSTTTSGDDGLRKARSRPSDVESRGRGQSVAAETVPSLPAPEFTMSNNMPLTAPSPSGSGAGSAYTTAVPNPHQYYYRDYYSGIQPHSINSPSSRSPEMSGSGSRSVAGTGPASTRPSTGRSFDSGGVPRQSSESATQYQRDSNTTYNSNYPPQESHRYSNLFHSALPLPDDPEENHRSSRASSRERTNLSDSFNVLWLAASLFEFNITTTKHEAGYPYLTYQAGEIFDVIAEKGELWLAKNQDDPSDQIGWIWSKHFAKLADA